VNNEITKIYFQQEYAKYISPMIVSRIN